MSIDHSNFFYDDIDLSDPEIEEENFPRLNTACRITPWLFFTGWIYYFYLLGL